MPLSITALKVLLMLAYALPGFLFIKFRVIGIESTSAVAKLLMYVCQPCLQIYSFNKVADKAQTLALGMGVFFVASLVVQALLLAVITLVLRRRFENVESRIATVACIFGNIGFFGTPLLEALLPSFPEGVAYAAVFIVSMNVLAWTFGLFVMTGDRKFMSFKKLLTCPPIVALAVALPLFFTGTVLPDVVSEPIELLGRMSLPLCMFVLGMRLATVSAKKLFLDKRVYFASAVKLLLLPLIALGIMTLLNIDANIKTTVVLLCACPTAALVQSLAEINGTGQKFAANAVLMSNILCAVTIPLLCLLL